MLFGIALVVMVLLCLLNTMTALQTVGAYKFADLDGMFDCLVRLSPFWVFGYIFNIFAVASDFTFLGFVMCFPCRFALFALLILSMGHLSCVGLLVCFTTLLALRPKAVCRAAIFVKRRQWFGFLAAPTSFCYDFNSHFCLLVRRLWSEPVAAQTAVGLFYNSTYLSYVNKIQEK